MHAIIDFIQFLSSDALHASTVYASASVMSVCLSVRYTCDLNCVKTAERIELVSDMEVRSYCPVALPQTLDLYLVFFRLFCFTTGTSIVNPVQRS